jgi:nuclear pore complex protein Nup93
MSSNMGSLFGGSGLGATTTPQATSLFSTNKPTLGLGTQSTAPAQGAQTSSLFGQPQTQQQPPQTSSLFGGQSQTQQQPAQTASLFGGQSQAQQQPTQSSILGQSQQPATDGQAQGRASTQATQPAFFNSLLERGKKRPLSATGQNGNFDDIPSLQLGLDDIRRKARELGSTGQKDLQQAGTASKA